MWIIPPVLSGKLFSAFFFVFGFFLLRVFAVDPTYSYLTG